MKAYWEGIFGPLDRMKGSDNDLFALAERLKASHIEAPKIYIWCGTEDFIYEQSLHARDYLRELGFDVTYEESCGTHEWKYWDEKIKRVLGWLPIAD